MRGKRLSIGLVFIFLFSLSSFSLAKEGGFEREDIVFPDNSIFLDRNGEILRFIPDENGQRHIWLSGKDIPDIVKNAFIAAEDERFYNHNGVDFKAVIRALRDNLREGRIVSGASTISQQVVRLIYPHERTYKDKIIEIFRSGRLEENLSKDGILEQYLNRVPMGNNIVGINLASIVYFNKSIADLSVAEAAVLASLPKAPGQLNPYGKSRGKLLKRKNWVLSRMLEQGYLTEEEFKKSMGCEIVFNEKTSFPNKAQHLVDLLIARGTGLFGKHYTTLDSNLQKEVEKLLNSHKTRLASRGASQAAAIIVHNPTMEVLVSVGSFSYSEKDSGYNNGTIAFRSAGSTIKPLLYAQALEQGYTVSSLLEDVLRRYWTPFGSYSPDNFDRKEYGPVTMRVALGNSLNISAIRMVEAIEIEPVYQLLQRVNLINNQRNGAEHYGLGLVIGNAEVSLEQLVSVYAMFANEGVYRPLRYLKDDGTDNNADNIFSRETAYIISDILSDPSARMLIFGSVHDMNFPFKISLKTGTSTKYRDGWIIGYTPEYTVGVWIGNFDGAPTTKLSGSTGAAPIFKDIIYLLHGNAYLSSYARPENVTETEVCGISGMKPGPYCNYVTRELFIKGTEPVETCTFHKNEKYFHELPTTYAGWIYEKNKQVSSGSYRLKGFSRNLENVFQEEQVNDLISDELPGIRIKNRGQKENQASNAAMDTVNKMDHYSVGAETEDRDETYTYPDNRLSITYPLPHDRFIIDKNKTAQVIRLETISYKPIKYMDWFIDGRHYARTGPPYHTYWKLEKGKHSIMAVAPDRKGDSIEVTVE
ncbi:MAG: penicillin-binding protein 1C [Nitrospirae bacterium]|nr:penicillin-binding protein 1C [Nitrospirota bacterium]